MKNGENDAQVSEHPLISGALLVKIVPKYLQAMFSAVKILRKSTNQNLLHGLIFFNSMVHVRIFN